MRLTIDIFAAAILLALCLVLAFLEVDRRSHLTQLETCTTKAEERERLEDDLENALVKQLAPGCSIDENPYYRILVDQIVTESDTEEYASISEFVKNNVQDAPTSFERCEFHKFEFWIDSGAGIVQCIVVVRDHRCVAFYRALASIRPV
jgi:hypothetical protein